jgi:hypothetical protein
LIANWSIVSKTLFFGGRFAGKTWTVIEGLMVHFGVSRENRARFGRIATDRHYIIEADVLELIEVLCPLVRD